MKSQVLLDLPVSLIYFPFFFVRVLAKIFFSPLSNSETHDNFFFRFEADFKIFLIKIN